MKRFLTAIAISIFVAADAPACMPERPTHNAYMFSVFRREAMSPPFREAMNSWWKRYGGEPQSDDANYYENNADRLRKAAERRGDRQMLDYMRWLDAYLDVCRGIGMDKWDYPTKQELASRDSTLRLMLDAAQAYRGVVMREQYALLAADGMEANEKFEARYRANINRNHRAAPDDEESIWLWNRFTQNMQMNTGTDIIRTALWIIGLFTLLSGIVGVSNIMLITVKERTHEFGIRKAIGAKPWSILRLIITENCVSAVFFPLAGLRRKSWAAENPECRASAGYCGTSLRPCPHTPCLR